MELITFGSRDGEIMSRHNNGISMVFLRQSRTTTGNHILLIFKAMVDPTTSDAQLQTQDGGRSSDSKTITSSTREEKSWKLSETLTKRTETLELTPETTAFINNGISFTLMNGKVSPKRER